MAGVQDDDPVTYTETSRHVVTDHQEHKDISNSAMATQQQCDDDNSSSEAEDLPQSEVSILSSAGVSINIEELRILQAEQAPLELVTEVRNTL